MDLLALRCQDVVHADLPGTSRGQKEPGSQPVVTGRDTLILLA